MPRKSNTRVPSAGLKQLAQRAADQGRKNVFEAFQTAHTLIQDRIGQFADTHLGPDNARAYKEGIQIVATEKPLEIRVSLDGELPNALEEGYPSFDIKPGLLAGGSVKQGKNGPYVDVPLRHAASSVRGGIKNILTKLSGAADETSGGILARLPTHVKVKKQQRGLVKTTEGYRTFRRVSFNSSPQSWIHPGFGGIHAARALTRELTTNIMAIVRSFLRKGDR
jgi:hypothetical protein